MTELDDLRLNMANAGWNSSINSLLSTDANRRPLYAGHKIKFSKFLPYPRTEGRNQNEFSITANSLDNLLPVITILAEQASMFGENSQFATITNTTSIEPLTQVTQRKAQITPDMSVYEIIEEMLHSGWGYHDVFSKARNNQTPYRHFSFNRWDWQGRRAGGEITIWSLGLTTSNWDSVVYRLAKTALGSWDKFPDSIPMFDARKGVMVVDPTRTKIIYDRK